MEYSEIFLSHFASFTLRLIGISVLATLVALTIEHVTVTSGTSTISKIAKRNISYSLRHDLYVWVLDVTGIWLLVGKIISLGMTFYIAAWVNAKVTDLTSFGLMNKISFMPLQVCLFLLLADFMGYWLHRTFHMVTALWMLHKFHHSATEMAVFTARRDNPLVVPLFILFTGLPVAVFGAPSNVPFWITFFAVLHAMVIHSQICSSWGFFGRWILVSPYGHKVHHSMGSVHINKNFAFMFPIWDQIFGTYYRGSIEVPGIGIGDEDSRKSLTQVLRADLGAFVFHVKQWLPSNSDSEFRKSQD